VKPAPDPARIPVAILAGGLGTRLQPAIGERAKGVADVGGRPFLAYVLDQLARAGFCRAVLCVGWRADEVEAALGASHGPLRLLYSREASPLGTAGALRRALPLLDGDAAMVMNGDSYCDVDLGAAWAWHAERAGEATLVAVEVEDAGRYGRVEIDDAGTVRAFSEKQRGAGAGWINAGIYLLARSRIEALPERPASLERDVLPGWVGRGLRAFCTRGQFLDIGTPPSYRRALRFFQRTEDPP
jgi:NDP-sugar pyrophosphorylase family protein